MIRLLERNSTVCHSVIDVWNGMEQGVIDDDAIDEWHRRLRACVQAKGGSFKYSQ